METALAAILGQIAGLGPAGNPQHGIPFADTLPEKQDVQAKPKRVRRTAVEMQQSACQAEGCSNSLNSTYSRKYRVCGVHMKSEQVLVKGEYARFCQKCSRFHPLSYYDGTRRTCRLRLQQHNSRRRFMRGLQRAQKRAEEERFILEVAHSTRASKQLSQSLDRDDSLAGPTAITARSYSGLYTSTLQPSPNSGFQKVRPSPFPGAPPPYVAPPASQTSDPLAFITRAASMPSAAPMAQSSSEPLITELHNILSVLLSQSGTIQYTEQRPISEASSDQGSLPVSNGSAGTNSGGTAAAAGLSEDLGLLEALKCLQSLSSGGTQDLQHVLPTTAIPSAVRSGW